MNLQEKCRRIKLLLTDVDGVLTDGSLYFTEKGEAMKAFNVKDGMGFKRLLNKGIEVGILTGRKSEIVKARACELGIKTVFQGLDDKEKTLREIKKDYGIGYENIAYIGDDINDLSVLRVVGLSASPADGMSDVLNEVDYVCKKAGGQGAFREFADWILNSANSTIP